jgi:predicted CXXCH cytochrome family protein
MKSHVLRPLWLALGFVGLILIIRAFYVPPDFGIQRAVAGRSFTYGYHRLSNIKEWKAFPVKYRGRQYCADCHDDKAASLTHSKHRNIQCENCHGPALGHPDNPEKLTIDRSRELCLRCHTLLPYPTSQRDQIEGIDPAKHNPEATCSECHNPHLPDMEAQ